MPPKRRKLITHVEKSNDDSMGAYHLDTLIDKMDDENLLKKLNDIIASKQEQLTLKRQSIELTKKIKWSKKSRSTITPSEIALINVVNKKIFDDNTGYGFIGFTTSQGIQFSIKCDVAPPINVSVNLDSPLWCGSNVGYLGTDPFDAKDQLHILIDGLDCNLLIDQICKYSSSSTLLHEDHESQNLDGIIKVSQGDLMIESQTDTGCAFKTAMKAVSAKVVGSDNDIYKKLHLGERIILALSIATTISKFFEMDSLYDALREMKNDISP